MKKYKGLSKITSLIISVIIFFCIILIGGGVSLFKHLNKDGSFKADGKPSAISAYASTAAASSFGRLTNGSVYYYTSKDKINNYRNGTINTDTEIQTVNTSASHGTLANPYVISSVAHWNLLATSSSYAKSATNVFVLGGDINFSGESPFKNVDEFYGKLYGRGYYFRNITDTGNVSSGQHCGIFTILRSGSIVADLNVENYIATGFIKHCGGISSASTGGSVYNCHVRGTYTASSTNKDVCMFGIGGIIGYVTEGTADVYRCSSFVTMTASVSGTSNEVRSIGGIVGKIGISCSLRILDCFAITKLTSSGTGGVSYGGIASFADLNSGTVPVEISNVVAYSTLTLNNSGYKIPASIIAGWNGNNAGAMKLTLKNIYAAGKAGSTDLYGMVSHNPQTYLTSPSVSNVNWCASGTPFAPQTNWTDIFALKNLPATRSTNISTMYSSSATGLPDRMWVKKSLINSTYMTNGSALTDTSSIANSPVRNNLGVRVQYYDATDTGETPLLSASASVYDGGWQVLERSGSFLDIANYSGYTVPQNHKFKGWSTDRTSRTALVTSPGTMLGDIKLYAVWEINTVTATFNTAESENITVDPSTKAVSFTATQGSASLAADITVPNMTDGVYTVSWKKTGDNSFSSTNVKLNLTHYNQRGEYYYTYTVYSKSRPLWYATGTTSVRQQVNVLQMDATIESAAIDASTRAFVGKQYSAVKPVATVKTAGGVNVSGTTTWVSGVGKITAPTDGNDITKQITFNPTSDDYKITNSTFDLVFTPEYLRLIFEITGVATPLTKNLEYGQKYSNEKVVEYFIPLYKEFYENYPTPEDFDGLTPTLKPKGTSDVALAVNSYKTSGRSFDNVTDDIYITVDIVELEYTVTFEPRNGGQNSVYDGLKYNNFIVQKPEDPTNGNKLFLGWYHDLVEEGATKSLPWDFLTDRISGNTVLYAVWLEADTLTAIVATVNKPLYACQAIKSGDLTVKATFTGTKDGKTVSQTVDLAFGVYDIEYIGTGDNLLHVSESADKKTELKISYTFNNASGVSSSAECTVKVAVTPISVQLGNINLGQDDENNIKAPYTGEPFNLRALRRDEYPEHVTGYSYVYMNSRGQIIRPEDVIATGNYTVNVLFEAESADYSVPSLTLRINIGLVTDVYFVWDEVTEFEYNGEAQYPKAKVLRKEDDSEVTGISITYGGDTDATVPNSYTVTASVGDSYTVTGGNSCNFTIKNAVLAVPTVAGNTYNGGVQTVNLNGYESDKMSLGGTSTGTDAASYTATVTLNQYYEFTDGTASVDIDWEIQKAELTIVWSGYKFEADGNPQRPEITSVTGFFGSDVYADGQILVVGEAQTEIGSYEVNATIDASAPWANNYRLRNPKRTFAVLSADGMNKTLVVIEWQDTTLKYDGTLLHPTAVVKDMDDNVLTDVTVTYGGDYYTSKWAKDYSCTASVEGEYYVISGGTCDYTITLNDAGEGEDPGSTTTQTILPVDWNEDVKPPKLKLDATQAMFVEYVFFDADGNEMTFAELSAAGAGTYKIKAKIKTPYVSLFDFVGGVDETEEFEFTVADGDTLTDPNLPDQKPDDGDGGFKLPENFPLWQIATSAAAIILILVFAGKCASYDAKKRKAKRDAKNYGTTYKSAAFLPVFSTVTVLFGMSNMVWSIIAFGLLGIMLILFVAMLVKRSQYRKADDALAAAIESDRRQREEERIQRDEEMKMMLMGMMSGMRAGNSNAAPPQQDTAQIVKDVVAALLPQMQAMLPAGSVVLNAAPAVGVAATAVAADYDADEEDWGEVDDEDDVFDPNESATTEVEADPTVFETEDGKQPRVRSNFRVRLKATTDKNRGTYVTIKNYLNAQKHVTFRMSGRIEKVKHGGEVIAVIGIAKKSLKIWLALNPNNYDVKRYYHKDVSDKPRFAETPMLIRVASERGIKRACELFDDLFTKFNVEARKNYEEKGLIELAFTLKQNPLFKDKRTELIRMSVTDDAANKAISDSAVNEYILRRERVPLEEEKFATVSLDAIDKEFLDGQKVTLQKLQAKGIVGEEFNGYKVTRGEKLTKPLCIIADGISATAAKMIVLTGGIALKLVNPDELDDKK